MKNNYRVEGNTVYIEVISKGKTYEVLMDKEDADKFSKLDRKISLTPNKTGHYTQFSVGNKPVPLHRWLMGFPKKPLMVNHIISDGLDNRRCNLEITDNKGNAMNLNNKYAVGVSGHKGVIIHPPTVRQKRYQVRIRSKSYGYYATLDEAATVAKETYLGIAQEELQRRQTDGY